MEHGVHRKFTTISFLVAIGRVTLARVGRLAVKAEGSGSETVDATLVTAFPARHEYVVMNDAVRHEKSSCC